MVREGVQLLLQLGSKSRTVRAWISSWVPSSTTTSSSLKGWRQRRQEQELVGDDGLFGDIPADVSHVSGEDGGGRGGD